MVWLSFFLQMVGIALIGYVALNTSRFLFARFPLHDHSSGWWWTKWVPLMGFWFVLMGGLAARFVVFVLGIVLIAASLLWRAHLLRKDTPS